MPTLLTRNTETDRGYSGPGGPVVQDFDAPKVWRDGKLDGWKIKLFLDDGSTREVTGTSKRGHGEKDAESRANELWGHPYADTYASGLDFDPGAIWHDQIDREENGTL